jgi:hypothetical protein
MTVVQTNLLVVVARGNARGVARGNARGVARGNARGVARGNASGPSQVLSSPLHARDISNLR